MLLADPENLKEFLRELDPETGQVIARPQVELSYADIHIGAANGSVACMHVCVWCVGVCVCVREHVCEGQVSSDGGQ